MPASAPSTGNEKIRTEVFVQPLENGHDSVSMDRLVSSDLTDLVGPGMDHRFAVDVLEICQDTRLRAFSDQVAL
jgi:hypothetical protein